MKFILVKGETKEVLATLKDSAQNVSTFYKGGFKKVWKGANIFGPAIFHFVVHPFP